MASERVLVSGLRFVSVLTALWNNQKDTRHLRKLQRKYTLPSYLMPSQMEGLIVYHSGGDGIKTDSAFLIAIQKQLGIDPNKFGPLNGDGYFYPTEYNNINGGGLGEKVVEQLRQNGSVNKI